jgi:hypothetical protein
VSTSPNTDDGLQDLFAALAHTNPCFAVFAAALPSVAVQHVGRFYRYMPLRPVSEIGPQFSRAAVWREYFALRAERAGDAAGASAVRALSDEEIIDEMRDQRLAHILLPGMIGEREA